MAEARNPELTPQQLAKLEEAFLIGCSDLEACYYAQIGKSTLYYYQNSHPEFVERKEYLKKNPTLIARRTVVRDLVSNSDLALRYLERKEKDEFSSKSELNTNLTFTQMPVIQTEGKDETGKPIKVSLEFNIGTKIGE